MNNEVAGIFIRARSHGLSMLSDWWYIMVSSLRDCHEDERDVGRWMDSPPIY